MVDRHGNEEPLSARPDFYSEPGISPDGTKIAVTIGADRDSEGIWIWDCIRKTMTPLTVDEGQDSFPVWTPDGRRIAFHTHRKYSTGGVHWKAADGTGEDEPIGRGGSDFAIGPSSWANAKHLAVWVIPINGVNYDIGVLSMEGNGICTPILKEKYSESQAQLSPDGRSDWHIRPTIRAEVRSVCEPSLK